MIVAAADRSDSHRTASAAIIETDPGPLISAALVIAEAGDLLERQLGAIADASLYTSIIDGDLDVEPLAERDWTRASLSLPTPTCASAAPTPA